MPDVSTADSAPTQSTTWANAAVAPAAPTSAPQARWWRRLRGNLAASDAARMIRKYREEYHLKTHHAVARHCRASAIPHPAEPASERRP